MAVVDRCRHQCIGLTAGVAEHDALVASALILVVTGVDALSDMSGLRVQQDFHLGILPVKAVLLVSDILDGFTGNRFEFRAVGSAQSVSGWLQPGKRG